MSAWVGLELAIYAYTHTSPSAWLLQKGAASKLNLAAETLGCRWQLRFL